ncbi:hypothetical protein CFK41_17195 [Brachybacterium ginsengisoli]|uniref:Uncharacterized protein n=1 Tax=Brachybacterium ginsengisoli TaxID=1331682 RepID=A0A291H1H1_9MICO|nr:hypothetical protein CFK41_17195 [Brachybacterium ginsengisoli]
MGPAGGGDAITPRPRGPPCSEQSAEQSADEPEDGVEKAGDEFHERSFRSGAERFRPPLHPPVRRLEGLRTGA